MRYQISRTIALIGIFFGLMVVSAHAQAPSKVEVSIPFQFSAGKTTLEHGTYTIKRLSGNLLMLRSENGKSVILNAPVTHTSNDPNSIERLVFNKRGEEYFLSQIWLTADTGRQISTEQKSEGSERVEIALRRK
jgi:hypothetical protein